MDAGLLPSILDRLVDPESAGTLASSGYTVEQMSRAVQDDLERLLNTRSNDLKSLEPYRLLSRVMGYGLPDLAALSRLGEQDLANVCQVLEEKIIQYEPRLRNVRVTPKEIDDKDPLKVQFQLQATLAVDLAPEVVLDTTLDLASGHFVHE